MSVKKPAEYSILIHYSEIGLKKSNRSFFEKKFIANLSEHIIGLKHKRIRLVSARILIERINFSEWPEYKLRLKNVMGLANATLMLASNMEISDMHVSIDNLLDDLQFENFRVTTKRHYKGFPITSLDINILIGEYIQKKTSKKVKLTNPDRNFIIEILKDKIYIGFDKFIGFGGLPASCQEKAFSLISSGIDSPVASFEMIKRGVELDYIHFHSFPAINKQSINNVKKIIKILSQYQLKSRLFLVPLLEIQQKIMQQIDDKFWVLFFRRAMVKLSNMIAEKNNGIALVTGESVGQVASQTLSNIRAVADISDLPILRPLSGLNKIEIIEKAKNIKTYDVSIKPYEDCCSYFVPIHPETKAKIDQIKKIHSNLDLSKEYKSALKNIEELNFNYKKEL